MSVPDKIEPFVELPPKPEGAKWAKPANVIRQMNYRADGEGYLEEAHLQLFVVPAEGGTPRQLTTGAFHHGGPLSWSPDGKSLLFSSNRHEDWEYDPVDSEVYEISLADGSITPLTDRDGPDSNPVMSPDGTRIAYVGFDDRLQGYQVSQLHVMNRDGSAKRILLPELDRDIEQPVWSHDSGGIYFQYDDRGNTKVAHVSLDGKLQILASDLGGVSHGRPYSGGSFSVADNGRFAYTCTTPEHPADIATGQLGNPRTQRMTHLNDDLFAGRQLGATTELWCESSHDRRKVQAWVVTPPQFDPARKYPLILEIHGGPFANYGNRFTSEIQLYAAAGYVVVYVNPRGSTSYGEQFGNLIHHNYPGQDYDDLMSAVDAVIAKGSIDTDNLFVTGGSGGGVLTAWIVGKTDRFRAAVSAKPVINWYSFALTSDGPAFFYRYWFPGYPWDHAEHYLKRSPLSLVGNVKTPTMLLTGEADYRTPISESEQFFEALKLRKVDTALVRIPDASHGMDGRPSHLMNKVAHILKWFEIHRTQPPK
jgi:acylaminoacyl-peptidase